MEPVRKRPRLEKDQLDARRAKNDLKLKSRFESIFEKYGKDFTGVGDEIDLTTGRVVVNNGHLQSMRNEQDVGGDLWSGADELPQRLATGETPGIKQECPTIHLDQSLIVDPTPVLIEDSTEYEESSQESDELAQNSEFDVGESDADSLIGEEVDLSHAFLGVSKSKNAPKTPKSKPKSKSKSTASEVNGGCKRVSDLESHLYKNLTTVQKRLARANTPARPIKFEVVDPVWDAPALPQLDRPIFREPSPPQEEDQWVDEEPELFVSPSPELFVSPETTSLWAEEADSAKRYRIPWTQEEDELLTKLRTTTGTSFERMLVHFPGRLWHNLASRWNRLQIIYQQEADLLDGSDVERGSSHTNTEDEGESLDGSEEQKEGHELVVGKRSAKAKFSEEEDLLLCLLRTYTDEVLEKLTERFPGKNWHHISNRWIRLRSNNKVEEFTSRVPKEQAMEKIDSLTVSFTGRSIPAVFCERARGLIQVRSRKRKRKADWSPDEDQLLRLLRKISKQSFEYFDARFPTKTWHHLINRWKKLQKMEDPDANLPPKTQEEMLAAIDQLTLKIGGELTVLKLGDAANDPYDNERPEKATFTREEDELLRRLRTTTDMGFETMAKEFPGKKWHQLSSRWRRLKLLGDSNYQNSGEDSVNGNIDPLKKTSRSKGPKKRKRRFSDSETIDLQNLFSQSLEANEAQFTDLERQNLDPRRFEGEQSQQSQKPSRPVSYEPLPVPAPSQFPIGVLTGMSDLALASCPPADFTPIPSPVQESGGPKSTSPSENNIQDSLDRSEGTAAAESNAAYWSLEEDARLWFYKTLTTDPLQNLVPRFAPRSRIAIRNRGYHLDELQATGQIKFPDAIETTTKSTPIQAIFFELVHRYNPDVEYDDGTALETDWTDDDDAFLHKLVSLTDNPCYHKLRHYLPNKSYGQIASRWLSLWKEVRLSATGDAFAARRAQIERTLPVTAAPVLANGDVRIPQQMLDVAAENDKDKDKDDSEPLDLMNLNSSPLPPQQQPARQDMQAQHSNLTNVEKMASKNFGAFDLANLNSSPLPQQRARNELRQQTLPSTSRGASIVMDSEESGHLDLVDLPSSPVSEQRARNVLPLQKSKLEREKKTSIIAQPTPLDTLPPSCGKAREDAAAGKSPKNTKSTSTIPQPLLSGTLPQSRGDVLKDGKTRRGRKPRKPPSTITQTVTLDTLLPGRTEAANDATTRKSSKHMKSTSLSTPTKKPLDRVFSSFHPIYNNEDFESETLEPTLNTWPESPEARKISNLLQREPSLPSQRSPTPQIDSSFVQREPSLSLGEPVVIRKESPILGREPTVPQVESFAAPQRDAIPSLAVRINIHKRPSSHGVRISLPGNFGTPSSIKSSHSPFHGPCAPIDPMAVSTPATSEKPQAGQLNLDSQSSARRYHSPRPSSLLGKKRVLFATPIDRRSSMSMTGDLSDDDLVSVN